MSPALFGGNSSGGSNSTGNHKIAPTTKIVQDATEDNTTDKPNEGTPSNAEGDDERDAQEISQAPIEGNTNNHSAGFPRISEGEEKKSTVDSNEPDQEELLTRQSPHKPTQVSEGIAPQPSTFIPNPTIPLQRGTSAPPVSTMRLEVMERREKERVGGLPRGVSLDFSPAATNTLPSRPPSLSPFSTTPGTPTSGPGQAVETPTFSAPAVGARNPATSPAATTAQAATPNLPGGDTGVIGAPLPVNDMEADVHGRKASKLAQRCRRLEKESARLGKQVKRGMKKVDKEYKLELKLLKEKRRKKCMRIEEKWERELKRLKRKRERLEEELGAGN